MSKRVIPIIDRRYAHGVPTVSAQPEMPTGPVADALARPLQDLRISVTDRCNFRCVYCMPRAVFDQEYPYLPHHALLSFEEITRIARIFIDLGVKKIRLTGGEPLLRKDIEKLIAMLSALKTREGLPLDLTLTTNGSLLARKAQALKDAGLNRVTVSLDSLDDGTFNRMNDVGFPVADVLHGIDVAHGVGLGPIKVNMVVKGGMNDNEIIPMARHFKDSPHILRFIEYMDVGNSNRWKMDEVIPSSEVLRRIAEVMPLEAIDRNTAGETAERWRYTDGGGEIGVISSVTHAFCGACNRARMSTEGKLYTCLFATGGHDLRALLRNGRSDGEITTAIAQVWRTRTDRYSAQRTESTPVEKPTLARVEMSYIGG
jgi:cyclic pyranopterin phosphate synthase